MKKLLLITATVFLIQTSNAQTTIDYFGQTPPGDKAIKFAPDIISLSNRGEYSILFSPDGTECFYSVYIGNVNKIYYTKRINKSWTEKVEFPYSVSFFSKDGNTLYIDKDNDIWTIERTAGGWGEPQSLPALINTSSFESGYTETNDSVAYIYSNRPGGVGKDYEIWRIPRINGKYQKTENLGSLVNSTPRNVTPCIAPDVSYLIFTQSDGTYEHLCISFNKGNAGWTKPVDMDKSGAGINKLFQNSPTLSPDGKYLFYNCHSSEDVSVSDIYWVSTNVLVGLKKYVFAPKKTKQIPNMNITTDSTINYVIPENTFSCEYGTASLKYTATLKNGSALPSWLEFDPDTRTLSGTPTQAGTDTLQITATNADTMSASCTFKIKVTLKVGISELDGQTVGIFPNPTKGLITLSLGTSQSHEALVEIYNLQGAQVFSKTFQNTPSATIDLTGHTAGIYVVKVIAGGVSYKEKIVKE